MNNEFNNSWIDPELEVRIVNLVLGEVSDAERAELEQLISEQPELAAYRSQMETVHGLLESAATAKPTLENEWRLSPNRRDTVLDTISGEAEPQATIQLATATPTSSYSRILSHFSKIAAVLCLVGVTLFLALPASFHASVSNRRDEVANELSQRALVQVPQSETTDLPASGNTNVPSPYFLADDVQNFRGEKVLLGTAEDFEKKSKTTLSTIAENLATYKSPPQTPVGDLSITEGNTSPPSSESESRFRELAGARRIAVDRLSIDLDSSLGRQSQETIGSNRELSEELNRGKQENQATDNNGSTLPLESIFSESEIKNDANWYSGPADKEVARKKGRIGGAWEGSELGGSANGNFQQPINQSAPESVFVGKGITNIDGRQQVDFDSNIELLRSTISEPWGDQSNEASSQPTEKSLNAELSFESGASPGEATISVRTPLGWRGAASSNKSDRGVPTQRPAAIPRRSKSEMPYGESLSLGELSDETNRHFGLDSGSPWGYRGYIGRKFRNVGDESKDHPIALHDRTVTRNSTDFYFYDPAAGEGRIRVQPKLATVPLEKSAQQDSFSTFSLHVSDVSFKLAQVALAQGKWPATARIRIEEFINAFDYGDPMPSLEQKVACQTEQAIHPFLQQRNLLRVSLRTAAAGRSSSTPLRLTLLLDNSGSMERSDRQETVRRALALLIKQLKPTDQVTLISFARQPRLLADKVGGANSEQLIQLFEDLPSEGGTNFEAALDLAFEKAREQLVENAQNRIILLTDGAANLGNADPDRLAQKITTMRSAGIAFDAAGIGADGLNDEILEALTRNGDGRYYLLDRSDDADEGFARQIAGALRPAAKNVKVQIEFNPKRVGRYQLLGFEKHRLKKEDFRNDQVDAAELAAAEAGVALYQLEPKPAGEGDVGTISVRFRDMSTGQMVEERWPIPYQSLAPRVEEAAPSLRLATTAALLATKLKGAPLGELVQLKTLSEIVAGLPESVQNTTRVQQLQQMIQQTRQLVGEENH